LNTEKETQYREKCRAVLTKLQQNSIRLVADYTRIDKIFDYYKIYREHIHENMDCKDIITKTEKHMDNHKIAAAFFCSFLKARPLSYIPDGSGVPPNYLELHANEQGAFLFGLQVVQDFWADKFENCTNADDREIYRKRIRLPETDNDSYIHWFIKLVIDGMEKYFNFEDSKFEVKLVFFISHIYSLLESYSYQFHKAGLFESRAENWRQEFSKAKSPDNPTQEF